MKRKPSVSAGVAFIPCRIVFLGYNERGGKFFRLFASTGETYGS